MSEYPDRREAAVEPQGERLVELIVKAMPGFEGKIDAGSDIIRVRGPIWLNGTVGRDVLYAAPDDEHYIEELAARMVEITRRHGIEALGLEAQITEYIESARREGYVRGHSDGRVDGIFEGRRQLWAELEALVDADRHADD